jgi:hypothetical protein
MYYKYNLIALIHTECPIMDRTVYQKERSMRVERMRQHMERGDICVMLRVEDREARVCRTKCEVLVQ